MKATHNGHCQICGAPQAVGRGNGLAKHGYAVRWNMFVGVCRGAGHQPFELGIDLILDAIEGAKKNAAGLRTQAAAERLKLDGSKTMHHVYLRATWKDRHSRYEWQEVEIRTAEHGNLICDVRARDEHGREQIETKRVDGSRTIAEAVKAGREAFARHLENEAKKFDEYAVWQTGRIRDWKPAPLLERK